MRFATEEHYNEFLEYLDRNSEIKEAYDTPNPFLPRDSYGLSLISDNGGTYNYFVAKMLWDYMSICQRNNADISLTEIVNFINDYDCSKDKTLMKNGETILSDYKYILIGKLTSIQDQELILYIKESKNDIRQLVKKP